MVLAPNIKIKRVLFYFVKKLKTIRKKNSSRYDFLPENEIKSEHLDVTKILFIGKMPKKMYYPESIKSFVALRI